LTQAGAELSCGVTCCCRSLCRLT